jgi:hypothetical protein
MVYSSFESPWSIFFEKDKMFAFFFEKRGKNVGENFETFFDKIGNSWSHFCPFFSKKRQTFYVEKKLQTETFQMSFQALKSD